MKYPVIPPMIDMENSLCFVQRVDAQGENGSVCRRTRYSLNGSWDLHCWFHKSFVSVQRCIVFSFPFGVYLYICMRLMLSAFWCLFWTLYQWSLCWSCWYCVSLLKWTLRYKKIQINLDKHCHDKRSHDNTPSLISVTGLPLFIYSWLILFLKTANPLWGRFYFCFISQEIKWSSKWSFI